MATNIHVIRRTKLTINALNHYIAMMDKALLESTTDNEYTKAVSQDVIDCKQMINDMREQLKIEEVKESARG